MSLALPQQKTESSAPAQFMRAIGVAPVTHARRTRLRDCVMLGVALVALAGIVMIAALGCSDGAAESDTKSAQATAGHLSAEQCEAGAEIHEAATKSDAEGNYVIQPGDQVALDFYLNPEFNDDVTVRPDGKVTLRLIGDVQAAGLTPEQFAQTLDKDYMSELRNPDAAVHVKSMPSRQVYVQGQVGKPGAFPLEPGMTALQAISAAGGLTDEASSDAVLIRRDACGRPYGVKVDLAGAKGGTGSKQDVALAPRDIVVVPRSGIASVDLFVKQYIQGLLPFPPYVSFAGPAM
jgi:protein involved in polysaccharide export with SLBB domain